MGVACARSKTVFANFAARSTLLALSRAAALVPSLSVPCGFGATGRPISLCVDGLPSERRLDRGNVDLLHGHHRLEGSFGRCGVRAGGGVEQDAGGDLPGEAPPVLAPAAG